MASVILPENANVILQEKAYFTRLSRLLVGKGTKALRITLDGIHPLPGLPVVLNANKTKLRARRIDYDQWKLLFPPSGQPPDLEKFDITLLAMLLRILPGLPPPSRGWDAMPPDSDNSPGANITRIRLFRNQVYGHVASIKLDKTTFDHLWLEIKKALVGLKIPPKEIDDLKTCPLSPEEEIYGQSLKEWFLKEEECKDMLHDLAINVNLMHKENREDREHLKHGIQQLCTSSSTTNMDDLTRNVNLMHNQLKDGRENMQCLRQIVEQSHQGIQQLCTSSSSESKVPKPMSDSGESKVSEKHTTNMDKKLAKHNFKSEIRRKVKSFHPGTREWLLKLINNWFELEDESRLLLITAGPGFGKSVFAAKVCEIFEEKGKLAACHFFKFTSSNLKDSRKMLQSLASHMCQNIVGFEEKLLCQLNEIDIDYSLEDAFRIYLQNPLDELEVEPSLIVIDGFDESATDDKSDMVKLIADNFPNLPECVKVLVTSRPELSVRGLEHDKKIEIRVKDKANESDILEYLKVCLPTLATRDAMNRSTRYDSPFEVLPEVVEKCEGSFLYAFHVQQELRKREDLDTMTYEEIMSFLPQGIGSKYREYFERLETELEAVMKRNPDLFKILEMLVAINTMEEELPLKFIARALDLALDCRETKKIINKVNDAVSCLLYVSDDLITVFHKSVYDWLVADGYDDHIYTVKVSKGKKELWLVCEQVFKEINETVRLGQDLKLTNEVRHSLKYGHDYLLACDMKDSFSWLVDMIIVHAVSTVHPKDTCRLHEIWEYCLQSYPALCIQLRQRISWYVTENRYLGSRRLFASFGVPRKTFSLLESALEYSPEGCFTDDEREIAKLILAKSPRCVKRNSVRMKSLLPLFTTTFSSLIVAVGVSANRKLAAVALENGTIYVLNLPELTASWQYSTDYDSISCCTFAPDNAYVLYGKLETVIHIVQRKETTLFEGEVEKFKSCAFSPNGNRLLTNDGSNTLKLWDVDRRNLVAVLSAGAPVDRCTFTNTGLFIVGGTTFTKEDTYCVWNSITLQRVDQRTRFSGSERRNKDGVPRSERCNRCFRQECKELIPSKGLGIMPSMQRSKISTGIYKEVDCIFDLKQQESLRVIESIHLTILAAWEIFMGDSGFLMEYISFVDIVAIEDEQWLYSDDQRLVVFNSVPLKENQPSPTCVLWCSFSPDGTRLATCTSDGFINLWNVDTSQVYQRFRSSRETSSAACWWSDKYLFVCHVTDTIPSLSSYPVDGSSPGQSLPLCSVEDAFLQFSGFLDFSEGHLSFECGRMEPVKVLDVKKVGHPKKIILPGIKPMMYIAVSSRASFVLGAGEVYFLWKKNETQSSVYDVVWNSVPEMQRFGSPLMPCFSNDSKFALVSFVMSGRQGFFVVDVDTVTAVNTGVAAKDNIQEREPRDSSIQLRKLFITDMVMIRLTHNVIEFFDLETWKRLDWSFQRHLVEDFVIHSKLSPKGTVLAVPRLTGDMEFFRLRIPKHSSISDGQRNWKRVGGARSSTSPGPDRFENISNVKKDVKESVPGPSPGRFVPQVEKKVKETAPELGRFGNISKGKKRVRETLPGRKKKVKKNF